MSTILFPKKEKHDAGAAREACMSYFIERGVAANEDDIRHNPDLVKDVQNLWHRKGNNGCVFSQAVASKAADLGWQQAVFMHRIEDIESPRLAQTIDEVIQNAYADPRVRILSLLFPLVVQDIELVGLINTFVSSAIPSIFLAAEEDYGDATTISLRMETIPGQQLAWIMGFGPFTFLPNTRHAPITELVIPAKAKPSSGFHRHSHDMSAAHVADVPTQLPDKIMEHLWDATYVQARHILNGEPDQFSAARTTFSVPTTLWMRRNEK